MVFLIVIDSRSYRHSSDTLAGLYSGNEFILWRWAYLDKVILRVSLVPRLSACCWRAWYIFSRDPTYLIARGRDRSKGGCTSLPSAGDIVSVLGLCHKRAPKSSYKKYRFAAFLRCLRTAAVLAHANIHPSTLRATHVRKYTRPTAAAWERG